MNATRTAPLGIETPVMKKDGWPSTFTKFGVITEINEGRAKILWQVEEVMEHEGKGSARRVNRHSQVKLSSLSVWPDSVRIRLRKENITVTADGTEYTTPKGV